MPVDDAVVIPGTNDYFVDRVGNVFSSRSGRLRLLKAWLTLGYPEVSIRLSSGRRVKMMVHRIVALAFHGPCPSGMECRHLDGNRTNNTVENLAYGTHKENMEDMVAHGHQGAVLHPERMPRGDRHWSVTCPGSVARGERVGTATITDAHVRAIRALANLGFSTSRIARALDISRGVAKCVVQGKTWTHVTEEMGHG